MNVLVIKCMNVGNAALTPSAHMNAVVIKVSILEMMVNHVLVNGILRVHACMK